MPEFSDQIEYSTYAINAAPTSEIKWGFNLSDSDLPPYVDKEAAKRVLDDLKKFGDKCQKEKKDGPPELVRKIYARVLERGADDSGMITWGSALTRGELTVKEVIRNIAKSPEHQARFYYNSTMSSYISILIDHLLARGAATDDLKLWLDILAKRGPDPVIDGIINGREYNDRFGRDKVPGDGRKPIYPSNK